MSGNSRKSLVIGGEIIQRKEDGYDRILKAIDDHAESKPVIVFVSSWFQEASDLITQACKTKGIFATVI